MNAFLRPELAPVLLAAPLVLVALWVRDRARDRRLRAAVGPRATPLADASPRRRRWKRLLFAGALLCALLAFLQPAWGEATRPVAQRGVDVVVCLDVSRSMLARDVSPSRLERARAEIRALARRARGDRIGLVVFAGAARLAAPLTRDVDAVSALAADADPLSVARGGSDLGAAIGTALDALRGQTGDHEAVVLLTDGEDLEGTGLRVARTAAERGIVVHCVGIGSPRGAKIPLPGAVGETYLRDRAGAEVVSAMDPARLRRIAETTGGAFVDAHAQADALVGLYEDRVLAMARKSFGAHAASGRENRFQWPLLAAFLIFLVEQCTGERRR